MVSFLLDIHLRLRTKHRRQRRLWVQIDREHAVARERQIMCEMRAGRRFRATALEIGDRKDLEMLTFASGAADILAPRQAFGWQTALSVR